MSNDRRKMTVHRIFEECASYTLDEYWKDIFMMCASNKFPKGLRYDPVKRTLYSKLDRVEAISVPKEPTEAFLVIIEVFRRHPHLLSPQELTRKKAHMREMLQLSSLRNCEWKQIRSKHTREFLISSYVQEMKDKHKLTTREAKNLFALVNLGFQFKKLSNDDVVFEEGRITDIKGLVYDSKTRGFCLTGEEKQTASKVAKGAIVDSFYQTLDRYVKDYQARRSRFRPHRSSTNGSAGEAT